MDQWLGEATVTLRAEMRLDDWAELALIVPGPAHLSVPASNTQSQPPCHAEKQGNLSQATVNSIVQTRGAKFHYFEILSFKLEPCYSAATKTARNEILTVSIVNL